MNGSPSGENRFRRGPDVLRYKVAGNRVTIARFCWKGKAHLDDGTECQDWADIYPPSQTDSETTADTLTIVVADGVSTQPQSGIGARLACDSIGRTLQALREPDKPLPACLADAQADFVAMCLKDRKSGSPENSPASPESTSVVEYATTALVLHLGQSGFWAATVGDGAIYAISEAGQRARTLTELRREGLVNEVRPFTSPKWEIGLAVSGQSAEPLDAVNGFCLMTDGFSESIGDPNAYFATVWPELRTRLNNPADLLEYAEAFCRYWEDRKFSDDDKTLLGVFIEE